MVLPNIGLAFDGIDIWDVLIKSNRGLNSVKLTFFFFVFQMSALKSANKELKGMMKTVRIQDIDVSSNQLFLASFTFNYGILLEVLCCFLQNLQDEMMDMMDVSNEIQETLGRSYNVPDDIDEDELLGGKIAPFKCSNLIKHDTLEAYAFTAFFERRA